MKQKLLLTFQFLLFTYVSQAKVFTVSNRPGNPAQYAKIADAIAVASAGDTIYIQGSETIYDNINRTDKKLIFIGPGHNPKNQNSLKATISSINFANQGNNTIGNGTTFIGLNVTYFILGGISDIIIKRCNAGSIESGTGSTKWVIDNNIVGRISMYSNPNNFIITNNIIHGTFLPFPHIVGGKSCLIKNNIFIGPVSKKIAAFQDITDSNILNNIFYGISPEGAINSIFTNNISYSNKATTIPYGTNSGLNNKIDVDPMFTKFPSQGDSFKYEYDFHLKASSPGKNAGTDGKDIGIYGGTGFSETGEPPIPLVREFVIINGVVAPNGKLNISVKAEAKN